MFTLSAIKRMDYSITSAVHVNANCAIVYGKNSEYS